MSPKVACATSSLSGQFHQWFDGLQIIGHEDKLPDELDILILTGGSDISPARYNEPVSGAIYVDTVRDEREFNILEAALKKYPNLKVLGVCRGMQLINIFAGGSLYQDLDSSGMGHSCAHKLSHSEKDHPLSWLTFVNSLHHQGLRSIGDGVGDPHIIALHSVPEIVVWGSNLLGVQFHPEMFDDDMGNRFFTIIKNWAAGEVDLRLKYADFDDDSDYDEEDDEEDDDGGDPETDVVEITDNMPVPQFRYSYGTENADLATFSSRLSERLNDLPTPKFTSKKGDN